jgi:hypothetical protein
MAMVRALSAQSVPMPRGRQSRDTVIIHRQEVLALRLLDRATAQVNNEEIPIDVQLDVFEKVGKWVSIKNRIEDTEETDIDRFKRRIAGEAPVTQGRRAKRADQAESQRLAEIKSRLPHGGYSGPNDNRVASSEQVSVTVGGSRGIPVGVPGDRES